MNKSTAITIIICVVICCLTAIGVTFMFTGVDKEDNDRFPTETTIDNTESEETQEDPNLPDDSLQITFPAQEGSEEEPHEEEPIVEEPVEEKQLEITYNEEPYVLGKHMELVSLEIAQSEEDVLQMAEAFDSLYDNREGISTISFEDYDDDWYYMEDYTNNLLYKVTRSNFQIFLQ